MPTRHGSPLFFFIVLSFMSGVVLGSFFIFSWPVAAFLALLGVLGILVSIRSHTRGVLIASSLLLVACLGLCRVELAPREVPDIFAHLSGTTSTIEGEVVSIDERETTTRVTVRIRSGHETTHVLASVSPYPKLHVGEQVRLKGKVTKPTPFDTDGGRQFAYDTFLAKDDIFLLMQRASVTVLGPCTNLWCGVRNVLTGVKDSFVSGIERALPEPESALAVGLLAGGKQGLGKSLLAAFTVSGLVQIVVLSGYNVMIIAEFILLLFRRLPRHVSSVLAGLVLVAFVLAAGAGTSAIRAGIMACFALYAKASGRSYDALRALAAALILMLLWNPLELVYDPGLQFSVLATLGLILLSTAMEVKLLWIRSSFWRMALATTLSAQIFVLPLLVYETGNLSLVALPANLLVMPILPLAMAASFAAALVALLIPPLAAFAGMPAYLLLRYVVGVAEVSSALPFAHVILPAFSFIIAVALYLLLFWFVWNAKRATPSALPVLLSHQNSST